MSTGPADTTGMTASLQAQADQGVSFPTRPVKVGGRVVVAAIADTPPRWRQGMAGQEGIDHMLFIMPDCSTYAFHMSHVERDLGIAVFSADGRVSDVGLMEAKTGFFRPRHPYKYALEFAVNPADFSIFSDIADGLEVDP